MFLFRYCFSLKYLKHINEKAHSLAQIYKIVQEKGAIIVMFTFLYIRFTLYGIEFTNCIFTACFFRLLTRLFAVICLTFK